MNFYSLLADYYDDIFPPDRERIDFINRITPAQSQILDIGCATGETSLALSHYGHHVTGIDLDQRMITIAKNKFTDTDILPDFHCADMRSIRELFSDKKFDLIMVLGNTLPHLQSMDELKLFIHDCHSLLNQDGKLLFQILNYDSIIALHPDTLPLIKTDKLIFKRCYQYPARDKIVFSSKIELINSHDIFTSSTELTPFTKSIVISNLEQTGFPSIKIFSNYQMDDIDETSRFYLFLAEN